MLTDFDKTLLNLVQTGLPIAKRPFQLMADQLESNETTVIDRLRYLKSQGYIRRIGPFFDSELLGYVGTLVGMKVRPDRIEQVAEIVNSYEEVTHNYEREGRFNLWFTLLASNRQDIKSIIMRLEKLEGVEQVVNLPATRKFKVNVQFVLE